MVEVAFYKAKKGKFFDIIVGWLTNSDFSHVELVIDNLCYSSSARDGGVRNKAINLSNGKWNVIELESTNTNRFWHFYKSIENAKYDFISVILNILFRLNINFSAKKFHCNEFVISSLNIIYGYELSTNMTLNELYEFCKCKEQQ